MTKREETMDAEIRFEVMGERVDGKFLLMLLSWAYLN